MQDEDEDDGNKIFSTSFVFASVRDKSISAIRRVIPTYACEEDDATVEFKEEKYLSNGDIYFGELSNGIPNGLGKYVWNDGCMYEGEWISGNTSGRGKFSWPSGATFEGEFKDGRIEGIGTLIGSDGSVYKGSWISDQKTGIGKKYYANGDFYEGFWRNDLQDGYGRYVWKNGNEYVGEWKSGIVSGHGILKWIDGSKYDGFWENGIPKGNGFFTSTHGKPCFINWSKDLNRNQQRFRDDLCLLEAFEEKFSDFKKRPCNHHDGILGSEKKLLPRICVWDSDEKAGDITCDILGVEEAASKLDFGGKIFEHDGLGLRRRSGSPCSFSGEIKKPGQTISQGHRNYDLMLSIQVGIRYSVGKMASVKARDTVSSDFYAKEKCWTKFPPEGSKVTPPHHSVEFKWRDYFPMVFRNLRELFMVDPADYMLAICGNDALRELSSPGKSGSFFYITQDDRFMIKTVKKSEVKVLLKMLPSYYRHVSQNQHSLITKFYGVHCIRSFGNQKVRFVVMGNFFCSDYQIHKRFDLKGSSYGRITHKSEEGIDETTTLKDLDLNFVFHLQKFWFHELLKQIDQDCEFLEAVGIMDYSLLVGVHFCEGNKKLSQKTDNEVLGECIDSHNSGSEINQSLYLRKHVIRLGSNMPATAEEVRRRNDVVRCGGSVEPLVGEAGKTYEVILYFGIIDILQNYDVTKKLEHAYKSLQIDSTSISAVDPKFYARRFKDFIRSVFVEDG